MGADSKIDWSSNLFPINPSLMGDGVRQTLEYLKALNPKIQFHRVASISPVFDWTVP